MIAVKRTFEENIALTKVSNAALVDSRLRGNDGARHSN